MPHISEPQMRKHFVIRLLNEWGKGGVLDGKRTGNERRTTRVWREFFTNGVPGNERETKGEGHGYEGNL